MTWTGTVVSPDIDADGVVRLTDTMIFSIDDQGSYHYRSDFNCDDDVDDDVDDDDLLILNAHYRHSCGAASHSVAEGGA